MPPSYILYTYTTYYSGALDEDEAQQILALLYALTRNVVQKKIVTKPILKTNNIKSIYICTHTRAIRTMRFGRSTYTYTYDCDERRGQSHNSHIYIYLYLCIVVHSFISPTVGRLGPFSR